MSDLTELTADEIESIGDQFQHFATVYKQIANEMRSKHIQILAVKGVPTLNYAMERIVGSVGSVQKSLSNARRIGGPSASMVAEPPTKMSIGDQAAEANRKATPSRKKKKG